MAFTQETVTTAFKRAKGKCEACGKLLIGSNRGKDGRIGAWEAHHITAVERGGSDGLSNCKILCIPCHKKTKSYGG